MATKLKPQPIPKGLPTFSAVLSNGREVTMRQAIAQDLLYISNVHGNKSDMEQGILMMARLATGDKPLTADEIQILPVQDLSILGGLVAKCTGADESEEEDEDPLEE